LDKTRATAGKKAHPGPCGFPFPQNPQCSHHLKNRTTLDTPKNKALLKLIKATKEKIIVFVKYKGTIERAKTGYQKTRHGSRRI